MHISNISAAEIISRHRILRRRRGRIRKVLGTGVSLVAMGAVIAHAQTSASIVRAQVVGASQSCPVVLVNFNTPMSMTAQSLSSDGHALRVTLSSSEPLEPPAEGGSAQPTLSLSGLGSADMRLDTAGETPVLRVGFSSALAARVTQSGARSLVIALATQGDENGCLTVAEPGPAPAADPAKTLDTDTPGTKKAATQGSAAAANGGNDTEGEVAANSNISETEVAGTAEATPSDPSLTGDESDETFKTEAKATKLLERARAAITAGDHRRAIQILTSLLALPENSVTADAQELLGLSRERNGQLAHATAEYETYLERYPDHEGATRVRQRLAAILTSQAQLPPVLRSASGRSPLPLRPGQTEPEQPRIVSIPRRGETFKPLGPQPGFKNKATADGRMPGQEPEEVSNFRATFSVYYYLNELSTTFKEFETNTVDDNEEVLQNSLSFGLDMSDERKIGDNTFSWRIGGDYELDMNDTSRSRLNLSRFYGNIEFGDGGPQLRFGRQTRYGEGIGGRFDGIRFSLPVGADFTFSTVLGIPVDRKRDPLFGGDNLLMGASVEYTGLNENTRLTAYVAGERREGMTERLVLGAGGNYTTDRDTLYGNIEYDAAFQRVNSARLSYSRRFKDKSSLLASIDYRHSPELTLSSALQGQTATTLTALSATYTEDQIRALALDRSSEIWTGSLYYQRPINEIWQFSADASLTYTTGNPASGGVAAVPAPGWEKYASAQIVGVGVFKENDVLSFSGRYADTASSQLFLLDAYWRVNVTEKLRLKPRLKLAHRNLKKSGGTEQFAIPSVAMYYKFDKKLDMDFEIELGQRFSTTKTPTTRINSSETIVFAGITKNF